MKIAVVAAMEEELKYFLFALPNMVKKNYNHLSVYTDNVFNHEIYALQVDIGKVNAAANLSILLANVDIDLIINIGSCGGIVETMEIGDMIIPESVAYHDVNVVDFGYQLGQLPGLPFKFKTKEKYLNLAEDVVSVTKQRAFQGTILTGDQFVTNGIEVAKKFNQDFISGFEMEAAAIAQTAHLFKTDFLILRSVSDVASKDSEILFADYLDKAAKQSAMFLVELLKKI